MELYNNERWLRNLITDLRKYDCVDIHYEADSVASDLAGEQVGDWHVTIETSRKTVRTKCDDILNALWFATTLAESIDNEEYIQRVNRRNAALAKLSPEDRLALGISS